MKITLALLPVLAGMFLFTSCASNPGTRVADEGARAARKAGGAAGKPDHEPSFDYWQNGGGACCAYHAQMYQAQAARQSRGS
jgi:hypothetical protein